MSFRYLFSAVGPMLIVGCTSIQVTPIDRSVNLKHVCIRNNPNVVVEDFLPVMREGFERHRISSEVFSGGTPERCEFVLSYTALRSWDTIPYLAYAEMMLETRGQKIATASFSQNRVSLLKWKRTKTKMDPVIDELLKAYEVSEGGVADEGQATPVSAVP